VGKSTLANQLFGQERSITADTPGTTRDWVADLANLDGLPIHLLDTPGQREASADPIERAAIARSRAEIERADLVVVVLDPTQPLDPAQSEILARYPSGTLVVNKSDLPAEWDATRFDGLYTVATTGQGVDELRNRIRERFGCAEVDVSRPRCWTARQREIVARAINDASALTGL
jgi:tRNA modification GTPase